jgi:transcriptional regulator with XRE-family HTH domain
MCGARPSTSDDGRLRITLGAMGEPAPAGSESEVALGPRVRRLRTQRGMSARDLAAAADLSPGFISQLERGLANPSVATLLRICGVLNVQIGDLFTDPRETRRLVRKSERAVYEMPDAGFQEARVSVDPKRIVELVWSRIMPGGGTGDELLRHGSETECVYVLSGRIEVVVGDERYNAGPGDCVTIPGEVPHGCFNRTKAPAELLWVTAPAVY